MSERTPQNEAESTQPAESTSSKSTASTSPGSVSSSGGRGASSSSRGGSSSGGIDSRGHATPAEADDRPARVILDGPAVHRAVVRIAHEIVERNRGTEGLAVIGIRSRGDLLALRIVEEIERLEGVRVPYGAMDVTLYRDDITRGADHHLVRITDIPFEVDDATVLLVDDVLFTGRTVRSALDALMDFGRPQAIQLAVLVDRGHRELPIRADYVGKNLPTQRNETVRVRLREFHETDEIAIVTDAPSGGVE